MSHRRGSLGGLNIHRTTGAGKPSRSGKVTIEVPATLSEAKRMLAASYRRAGFSQRQAAMKVAEVVAKVRSRAVAA